MIVALWPSDAPDIHTLLARITEIRAAGDTPYCPPRMVGTLTRLLHERRIELKRLMAKTEGDK